MAGPISVESASAGPSQPYDFRNPSLLAEPELRKLRSEHEEIAEAVEALLSIYMRMEVGVQLSGLKTLTFRKFKEALPSPAHFTLFKVDPLHGRCLVQVPLKLAISIVDRLMGGAGEVGTVPVQLSEIEVALLDQATQLILTEWSNHWKGSQNLKAFIVSHETNSRYLQMFSDNDILLEIDFTMKMGGIEETIQVAFPYEMLEPLIRHLVEQRNAIVGPSPEEEPVQWKQALDSIELQLTAEWCIAKVSARSLVQLQVGDLFEIDPEVAETVSLKIAERKKFVGRLGFEGKNWAVQITSTKP